MEISSPLNRFFPQQTNFNNHIVRIPLVSGMNPVQMQEQSHLNSEKINNGVKWWKDPQN